MVLRARIQFMFSCREKGLGQSEISLEMKLVRWYDEPVGFLQCVEYMMSGESSLHRDGEVG